MKVLVKKNMVVYLFIFTYHIARIKTGQRNGSFHYKSVSVSDPMQLESTVVVKLYFSNP